MELLRYVRLYGDVQHPMAARADDVAEQQVRIGLDIIVEAIPYVKNGRLRITKRRSSVCMTQSRSSASTNPRGARSA